MIRSLFFYIACLFPTIIYVLIGPLLLPFKQKYTIAWTRLWVRSLFFLLKHIQGLSYRVEGMENIPNGPFIIASKHQSIFETFVFPILFYHPYIILKKELGYLPYPGWGKKYGVILVDRSKPKDALRLMVQKAEEGKATNRPLLIFPEGTRVAPGSKTTYKPGIAIMYDKLQIPVVPIAVNTGYFWGRRSFYKKKGVATLSILPVIPAGLDKSIVLERLEECIEKESTRLLEGVHD